MRVNYTFTDSSGEYDIEAEVSPTGKVNVVDITDEYGTSIGIEDFSESEVKQIGFLAKEAADELDKMPDADYDDDLEEDGNELPMDY